MTKLRLTAAGLVAALLLVGCAEAEKETPAQSYGVEKGATKGEDRALHEKATVEVDTSKYTKDGPLNLVALTQGPINGWGLTWDVTMKAEAAGNPDIEKLTLLSSGGDANKQINSMENVVNQKPDAILLVPMSYEALVAPTERAMAAGIPVVICANHMQTDDYVSLVTQDLYKSGYEAADALAEQLDGKGKVLLLSGIAGVYGAEIWKKAAQDALKEHPEIEIVGNEYADWSVATAKQKTAALLAGNPQVDGVWAGGSEMALGALLAIKDAGREQPVYSVDNPINGFLRVAQEENVEFTAFENPPSVLAKACLDTALKVLKGETVKKVELLPAESYDHTQIAEHYVPELNDDFVPPAVAPVEAYAKEGMQRK